MANFLAQSMDIEYADTQVQSLPEATQTAIPLGPSNLPEEFVELSLEDCIAMAMQNSKILRVVGGSNQQTGSVSNALLSAQPGQLPSVYDPAIMATTSSTQPLVVDSQGNRVAPRGSSRSNQVGGVEDALSEFDTQFSAIFGYNTTDRPRNVGPGNPFNPQLFQGVDSNGQAAISKRHANGTITTARFTTVYSRNNIPTGVGRNVASDYTAALELQVTQPLLRGRGTLVNRIPVTLARINEDLALHEFEIGVRNMVQAVEHAYWDLYCGYRAFDTARIARDSARSLWKVANERLKIGKDAPQAAFQAEGLYYQFDAQMRASLNGSTVPGNDPEGLVGRERRLRELIGWGATDGQFIRPLDEPSLARIQFNWCDVVGEGLTRSVELRRQKWAIKQDELELISARNQVLPQLDLVGFYRFLGVGDTFASSQRSGIAFPNPGSNALEGLTDGGSQELGARLEFTPQAFGKRRAMANIQNSQFQIKKTQEELREKEVMLVFRLADAWTKIESDYELIHVYQQQWAANQKEINVYQAQIEENVGDLAQLLDQLLRAEERRTRAEQQYHNAVCDYNKWIVNLHALKGSLLDLNSIELQEGAWVDKAYWDAEERARERAGGIYFDYGYTRPAVVSNGPVQQGMHTEGNISDHGASFGAGSDYDAAPAQEFLDRAMEGGEQNLESVVEPKSPTARLESGNGVRTVSNTATISDRDQYNWGGLGIDEQPRAQVVRASQEYSLSDTAANRPTVSGQRQPRVANSSGAASWTPR
ncbi:Outer membrane efflux protein [Aureliella helgolandensis]|uniref:Outer membrane efflux protein n=2 Tax=Aureliella helgolandensis TaxID=2527968 RepID=A0A518G5E8_9BACT|nr:Outer membrane efflux protein [Aureliella helgolandensis]